MNSFENFEAFPSLVQLLQPYASNPYDAGIALGIVDALAIMVIRKLFDGHSSLVDVQQRARDFLDGVVAREIRAADIGDIVNINELVAMVGSEITATYGNPPALNGRTISSTIAELEANVSTRLFQIAWQIVQLDTQDETRLFSAGFTALRFGEIIRDVNVLRDVELQPAGEPIDVRDITTPCEEPLPKDTVCSICQYGFRITEAEAQELEEGELLNKDPAKTCCEHVFHADCLEQWVNSAMSNSNLCPICRTIVCAQRPLELVELVEEAAIGEIPDSW
ncbi:hypothetical protein AOQ84DRAFT_228078 [Glonium stellatum]|uniref:RING-type domain-containing protein n=1 Tax=Glonium stellatum TaxID=574774 RepID=A0A8E2JMY8_9PEZI|nr:hypothetical protein AOQ84DRAFT_228078 [Glonium stellatum]